MSALAKLNHSFKSHEHQNECHVLLAEDDTRMRQLLACTLRRDGFKVTEAEDGADLLGWMGGLNVCPEDSRQIDLIISDIRMPTLTGLQLLAELRRDESAIPVILITAFGDEQTHDEAKRLGAAAIFDKPFDLDDIRTAALYYTGQVEEQ